MKKGQKMPEELRKRRSEYMKANPLKYWAGKKRKNFTLSAKGRQNIINGLRTREVSQKVIEHAKNLNKGKYGKDHPRYREVKKRPVHKSIRQTHEYKQWRAEVFKRDNYRCTFCGNGGYVEADHYPLKFSTIIRRYSIETLSQALECKALWNIKNGRTLCRKCHYTVTFSGHSKSPLIEVETPKGATLRKAKATVND